jgi:ABC-2 type transport system permease protein
MIHKDIDAIYTIWLREMKKFVRSKSRIVGNIAMPFFFLAFIGTGLNSAFTLTGEVAGVSYFDFLAPGVIAMTLLFSSMFAGISVLWDRQFGFLKEILVAPIRRVSIVTGKVLAGVTTGIIQALLILGISILMGVRISSIAGVLFSFVFIILISMSFVSLGIALASRIQDHQGFQMIMNFLIMPIWLLSGAFFPLGSLPPWLLALSYIDPLTYGVDGLRAALIGVSQIPWFIDIGVLAAFSGSMIILSSYLFSKTEV